MVASVTPISRARGSRRTHEPALTADRNTVLILLPVITLFVIGLAAVLSASSVVSQISTSDQFYYFKRQAAWGALSVGMLLITSRIPYGVYKRMAVPLLLVAIAGLVATGLVGSARGGSRRWIEIGSVTVQPSEFAKFAVVVFLATALSRNERQLANFAHFFWPVAVSMGVVTVLLTGQPDLGTTIVVSLTTIAILLASATPFRYTFSLASVGCLCAALSVHLRPYQKKRLLGFLNLTDDPLGAGLQPLQSLVALGTGGWFGVGLGASRARWSFLPNAHNDFIFSIIGEETGLAGSLSVVALFGVIAIVGLSIARRAPDSFGRLLAVGLVAWITFQALINIGGVIVVLPITGIPLPFVSSGGSAMLVSMAAVGVLVNIATSTTPKVSSP